MLDSCSEKLSQSAAPVRTVGGFKHSLEELRSGARGKKTQFEIFLKTFFNLKKIQQNQISTKLTYCYIYSDYK